MANLGVQSTLSRSAQSFILSALRLVGSLRSGQSLTNDELNDCLQVLNDMLDAWSGKRVTVFVVPRITLDQNGIALSLVAGKQTYLLGNSVGTEDFFLPRPPKLERVGIIYTASQSAPIELPVDMYDSVKWQGIPQKNITSLYPQVCYLETSFPDMSLNFWRVPTQSNPVALYTWQALQQFPDLGTEFGFPPGYARAIRYNLAVDLAAEFPADMQKLSLVAKQAAIYKADIESANVRAKEAYSDPALVGSGRPNIYTGDVNRTGRY